MKPQEIKAKLVRRGVKQADIARNLDPPITRQAIYRTIHGFTKNEAIQTAIARAIAKPVSKVFPRSKRK